jgi:hypothetical protein
MNGQIPRRLAVILQMVTDKYVPSFDVGFEDGASIPPWSEFGYLVFLIKLYETPPSSGFNDRIV